MLLALDPLCAARSRSPPRARLDHPGALRAPGRERRQAARARATPGRSTVAQGCSATSSATRRASCSAQTGLVIERGELGTWLVGEAGALLVAPAASGALLLRARQRPELPPSDRIAHLLLALRSDEDGFATVANLAFAGAPWRLRRRLKPEARAALAVAKRAARQLA